MNFLHICIIALIFIFPTQVFSNDHPCAKGKVIVGKIDYLSRPTAERFRLEGTDATFALAGLAKIHDPFDGLEREDDVIVYSDEDKPDRYGRLAVHAFSNGKWLQGTLLGQGKALRSGLTSSEPCSKALSEAERRGEAKKTGHWQENAGTIIAATDLEKLSKKFGHFVLVTGKVFSVGNRSRRIYLNFGQKWSQDFTVSVVKKGSGAFKGNVALLTGLKNKTVRVRGILEERQGPLIRLIHEAQFELLE